MLIIVTDKPGHVTYPVFSSELDVQFLNQFLCLFFLEVHDGVKDLEEEERGGREEEGERGRERGGGRRREEEGERRR